MKSPTTAMFVANMTFSFPIHMLIGLVQDSQYQMIWIKVCRHQLMSWQGPIGLKWLGVNGSFFSVEMVPLWCLQQPMPRCTAKAIFCKRWLLSEAILLLMPPHCMFVMIKICSQIANWRVFKQNIYHIICITIHKLYVKTLFYGSTRSSGKHTVQQFCPHIPHVA